MEENVSRRLRHELPIRQRFKKIHLFQGKCGPTHDEFQDGLIYDPKRVSDVRWNFEVFVINKLGFPVYRFSEDAPISDIKAAVKGLLQSTTMES